MTEKIEEITQNSIGFEEAMKKLEIIVKRLESSDIKLEDAIKDYEFGNMLVKQCRQMLEEAQLRIDKIVQQQGAEITAEKIEY
jgi:exodeoxyribonuclease VII small subunit